DALRRKATAQAATYLSRVLEIEFQQLPDLINVQALRADYSLLLNLYAETAQAMTALQTPRPKDFTPLALQAVDAWRSLDRDNPELYQQAGMLLAEWGSDALAWDYLTTPLALQSSAAESWLNLA